MNIWNGERQDEYWMDERMKWWKAGLILNGWIDEMVKGRMNIEWMNRTTVSKQLLFTLWLQIITTINYILIFRFAYNE